jgi:2-polyprenyl-6-hydroxyphenyl methylase/3-demethylubiquinone-9 3-methyltransferase
MTQSNAQQDELGKFAALADRWWQPDGEMRPLHDINPARLRFVNERAPLRDQQVLDVGCGAGILSEAMADIGAQVTGIDLAEELLTAGRRHAEEQGVAVDYRCISTRDLAAEATGRYDVVTCMEMLEHVPEPQAIVDDCARLVKPGGAVFFSTINRNAMAWALAIAGAEYILGLLPRGTHDYAKLIKPSELGHWARQSGLTIKQVTGLHYNPLLRSARIGGRPDVNYLMYCVRD